MRESQENPVSNPLAIELEVLKKILQLIEGVGCGGWI
jgi:hypothetical protein